MWWTAPIALALAANPHLDEARRLYEQLKYPDAVARLRIAQTVPNNTPGEKFSIDDLLARSLVAQGKPAEAEKVYAELVSEQPDAADPADASPKIRDVFLKAKRSVYPDDFVKLERGPSPPEVLEATLTDPWRRVAGITLTCDAGVLELKPSRTVSARLPAEASTCALTAESADAKVLTRVTWTISHVALEQSVVITQPEPAAPSGPKRWPAFLLGAVTIGAVAAGTVLAVLSTNDYHQVGPMTDAVTTRMLDNSARAKSAASWGSFGGALLAAAATFAVILSW